MRKQNSKKRKRNQNERQTKRGDIFANITTITAEGKLRQKYIISYKEEYSQESD